MKSLSFLSVALLAVQAAGQQPALRPEQFLTGRTLGSVSLASEGSLSALLYADGPGPFDAVLVRLSNGLGVDWGPGVDIQRTANPQNRKVERDGIQIDGDTIYAYWYSRPGGSGPTNAFDLHFNKSEDRGNTWLPFDVRLDKGSPPLTGTARDTRFVLSPDAQGDHLYFLFTHDPDSASPEDLNLVSSHDGGDTFSSAVPVSTRNGTGVTVEYFALAAEGRTVHALWSDDRNASGVGTDLFYRRSTDGGATWGPELRLDTDGAGVGDVYFDSPTLVIHGDEVVAGWIEIDLMLTQRIAWTAASTDGGQTFGTPRRVGSVTESDFTTSLALAYGQSHLIAAHSGTVAGDQGIYVTRSGDGGTTWSPSQRVYRSLGDVQLTEGAGTTALLIESFGPWTTYTADDGASWAPAVQVYAVSCPRWYPSIAYNSDYRNYLLGWFDAPGCGTDDLFVGGYRPQAVEPVGFVAGPSSVRFRLDGFQEGPSLGLVFWSFSKGSFVLPAGDGREVGLAPDALFAAALGLAPLFSAPLSGGGALTPEIPLNLPPGVTLHFAAMSIEPGTAFGDLSDVVTVRL